MKTRALLIAASAMAMLAFPAQAAVRYDFEAISTAPRGALSETFTGAFSYESSSYAADLGSVPAADLASCTYVGSVFGAFPCFGAFFLGDGGGLPDRVDFIGSSPSLGLLFLTFFFDDGALNAPGVYDSILLTGGDPLDRARLTVTDLDPGAVPEPASWAMMIAGFGMVGGALRNRNTRRRVTTVTYA